MADFQSSQNEQPASVEGQGVHSKNAHVADFTSAWNSLHKLKLWTHSVNCFFKALHINTDDGRQVVQEHGLRSDRVNLPMPVLELLLEGAVRSMARCSACGLFSMLRAGPEDDGVQQMICFSCWRRTQ